MDNQRLCIYVSTPYAYSDVFDVFIKCFEKYWKDCKYPIIISTNHEKSMSDRYRLYISGDKNDNWVTRSIPVLSDIKYDYILLMMDDSIIQKQVNAEYIDEIVNEMDVYNLNYCTLKTSVIGQPYKDSKILNRVRKNTPYAKNIFMGIFRRTYLLKELGDGSYGAWDIEKRWLNEARNAKNNEWHQDIVSCNKQVIVACNGVIGGKWYPSVKRRLIKEGIVLDDKRETVGDLDEFRMHLGSSMGRMLHPRIRIIAKKVLSKIGIRFATNS